MSEPAPAAARRALPFWIAATLIILLGGALRILPTANVRGVGFDETIYRAYVRVMELQGVFNYDQASKAYVMDQRRPTAMAALPPTRFLYIFCGYVWKSAIYGDAQPVSSKDPKAFLRDPFLNSLRGVSTLFSILTMLAGGVFAWRIAGRGAGLAVLALIACAPLQIHLSQHAMIDGFFAFWAMLGLWGLWESLQSPGRRRWLALYGAALFCMVLTKENAFFVFIALCGILLVNRWKHWGVATRSLYLTTLCAPGAAVLVLIALAGGFSNFIETYQLLVRNAQHLDYAIQTGDGPWYRYLVDLMVLSPVVLCLALAAALRSWRENKYVPYVLVFIASSYALMCNVRYGMNLRYAAIWDLPLCLLVFAQISWSARAAGRWAKYVAPALVALVCLHELHQYRVFFVQEGLYELGPPDLLHAVKILK